MKIIAVLLNPTIDEIYEIENFEVGGTFKVNKSVVYPAGKAISLSIAIRELTRERERLKVIALIGQDDIPLYSNFLNQRNIPFEFVKVNGKTRSNKTINDPIKGTTTHIRLRGFEVEKKILQDFTNNISKTVQKGDICVFSGSIPPNVQSDIYYELITMCKKKGAICVLDSNGNELIRGVKSNPKIIKPNLVELSQILNDPNLNNIDFSNTEKTCKIIVSKAYPLLNTELQIVLISLGDKGAICLTKEKALYGNVKVEAIDTVGSGDAFLAGFILYYALNNDLQVCFRHAIASGAANTLVPGPGTLNLEDEQKLFEKIVLKEIK